MLDPVDELTSRILREHLITGPSPGQCLCGWGGDPQHLGRWHSDHVVEALRAARVLRSTCD